MRILFLSTWFPYPPDNGSKIRVYHLLRALAQRHELTLLSFAWDTAQPDTADELRSWCKDVQVVSVNPYEHNRASKLRTFFSFRPVVSRPIAAMTEKARAILANQSFDSVISSTEIMVAYALQTPPGTVRILEEHNAMTRLMRERYGEQPQPLERIRCWLSWQKSRTYEARLFRRFDLVTMVSEEDRAACLNDLPGYHGRVAVIPNGVDCAHNRPGLAEVQPHTLIYNGALTYSANYDAMRYFLAEIYPRIRQEVPDVSLSITGSTRGVELSALPLDESVHLTGYVEDIRLPVAASAVCVVPLRQGGGTRLKILEAMALGTPVVATSKGAEGLEGVNGEHLLIADDPAAFGAATLRLLRAPALRARLAANARRLVEARYDWSHIGASFVELVENACHKGP
jgi:glycosyltransferase involved in cell wall biosynthesis